MSDLFQTPLSTIVQEIRTQQRTAESVMNTVYDQIEQHDSQINAYQSKLSRDDALKQARQVDARAKAGESLGALAGIPTALKNNLCYVHPEMPTNCASKILDDFQAPYDATVVQQLLAQDAIIIGKTNMDEFAMGSSSENSAYGPVKNPHDLERVSGGSSSGSAAVIGAKMALLALGSDTGGSIRQPASFCGVFGYKPSYGVVSRYGLVAYGSSLDQVGWFTHLPEDAAYVLPFLSAPDPKDATSAKIEVPLETPEVKTSTLKLGLPTEWIEHPALDPNVKQTLLEHVESLRSEGATIENVSLPFTEALIPTYYTVAFAEASSNLSRFDGIRYGMRQQSEGSLEQLYKTSRHEGFGPEVRRRILLGTFVLSAGYYDAYYGKARRVRAWMEKELETLFEDYDALIAPVAPSPAFKLGEKTSNPLEMYLEDLYSVLPNLCHLPAVSTPSKKPIGDLPIGIQLIGPRFQDAKLLAMSQLL